MVKLDSVEERNKACNENLGGGKEIEAKGTGKGGGQTMEHDNKPGNVEGTSIARQPLLPGQTPVRTLCAGQDVRRRERYRKKARVEGNWSNERFRDGSL